MHVVPRLPESFFGINKSLYITWHCECQSKQGHAHDQSARHLTMPWTLTSPSELHTVTASTQIPWESYELSHSSLASHSAQCNQYLLSSRVGVTDGFICNRSTVLGFCINSFKQFGGFSISEAEYSGDNKPKNTKKCQPPPGARQCLEQSPGSPAERENLHLASRRVKNTFFFTASSH